jgi:hypothetical protein
MILPVSDRLPSAELLVTGSGWVFFDPLIFIFLHHHRQNFLDSINPLIVAGFDVFKLFPIR